MNCPVCEKPVIALEVDQIEVDHCVKCGGVWLDAGELELLYEGVRARDEAMEALVPDPSVKEARRRCPICDKKMEKVRGGVQHDVIVDRCGKGHGVWLDKGELERVMGLDAVADDNRVRRLLVEIFGAER